MDDKKKYDEALKIVLDYQQSKNLVSVKDKTCCVCKSTKITRMDPKSVHPLRQEQAMWSDGAVELVTFGYGSKIDMNSYYVAICDTCMLELEKDGLAISYRELSKKIKY